MVNTTLEEMRYGAIKFTLRGYEFYNTSKEFKCNSIRLQFSKLKFKRNTKMIKKRNNYLINTAVEDGVRK